MVIWTMLLGNLRNIGVGLLLFVLAYVANMLFSLWHNIKVLGEPFDWVRLRDSAIKVLCFGVGLMLLCVVITGLPVFADMVGWAIPDVYKEIFTSIVIVGLFLLASCKYALEAFNTMRAILFPETGEEG